LLVELFKSPMGDLGGFLSYFAEAVFKNVGFIVSITYAHCGFLMVGTTVAEVVMSFAASVLLFEKYLHQPA